MVTPLLPIMTKIEAGGSAIKNRALANIGVVDNVSLGQGCSRHLGWRSRGRLDNVHFKDWVNGTIYCTALRDTKA
jgi:hypothetical protein